jgi:predicted GNAT family acetyltransferase
MADTEIRRNDGAGRYELWIGTDLAAFADFHDEGSTRHFPHTVTTTRFRGQGLAGQLVQRALDDADADNRTVVPSCWFVAEYIENHPRYKELVAS